MLPTCSNRDLAGRKALSATVLTIFSSVPTESRGDYRKCIPWGGFPPPLTVLGTAAEWWYVRRALGESRKSARHRAQGARGRIAAGVLAAGLTVAIGACGSKPRQDASEPTGDFPVEVTKA